MVIPREGSEGSEEFKLGSLSPAQRRVGHRGPQPIVSDSLGGLGLVVVCCAWEVCAVSAVKCSEVLCCCSLPRTAINPFLSSPFERSANHLLLGEA
jgi:hypothetical protein